MIESACPLGLGSFFSRPMVMQRMSCGHFCPLLKINLKILTFILHGII